MYSVIGALFGIRTDNPEKPPYLKIGISFLSVILILALSPGCTVRKPVQALPIGMDPGFSRSGNSTVADKWWTEFKDEGLNTLVEKAVSDNHDIRAAWYRLNAARAAAGRDASALFPGIEGNVSGETAKADSGSENRNDMELEFGASYELDLWGRITAGVRAGHFDARAAHTDLQTAALSVSSEIAVRWFRYIEALKQIELIQEQIETNQKMLSLIKARVGSGQVRGADILRQNLLIESGRTQKIDWETRAGILKNQLSILTGVSPVGFTPPPPGPLPELPPLPDTGIPADLVKRRPDVRSAFFRLKASDLRLASAIRDMYPKLSFRTSVSTSNGKPGNILKEWASSLAGNLLAPIFYGGRLRAEMKRSRALKYQLLHIYGKTVLTAFQEVEDALIREKGQSERIAGMERQVEIGARTIGQLRLEYFNGIGDYLDVLTVLRDEQRLRRELLSDRVLLLEYRISLYRAIAGGFEITMENEYGRK